MVDEMSEFYVMVEGILPELKAVLPEHIDAKSLAIAFGTVESGAGVCASRSRFEPSYSGNHYRRLPKGTSMFEKSAIVRDAFARWGDSAAMSYGHFQIMYTTALFLNVMSLNDPPEKLRNPAINFTAFVAMIKHIVKGDKTIFLNQIADAYNSGTYKDANIPTGYIEKINKAYVDALGHTDANT